MKKVLLIAIASFTISSCTSKWEYKVVSVKGTTQEMDKYQPYKYDVTNESLNLFGKDGWELVAVYDEIETVHPNFGNEEYVSGIQPNVRTAKINFIFKRKK